MLQINHSDISGGAAIAAYRLHCELNRVGARSRIMAADVHLSGAEAASSPPVTLPDRLLSRVTSRLGLNYVHIRNTQTIAEHPFYREADVVHFHNLHGNYFNYRALPGLTSGKPAVITLHDMWALTGHCAYSFGCERWRQGCGRCPDLKTYPAVRRDATAWEWRLKDRAYGRSNLTVVAPSLWLAEIAKQSLLGRFPVHHIPNGLDTELYAPKDKEVCRAALGIPKGLKVLMFVAMNMSDTRKGGALIARVLAGLPESLRSEIMLLTLGHGGSNVGAAAGIKTLDLGFVGGDALKAVAFNAADIFFFPTVADNLPLVLQESMACGTPMVSTNVGGVPELVREGQTGMLAEPGSVEGLVRALSAMLEDEGLRRRMGERCREVALTEYKAEIQGRRILEIYNSLLVAG